MKKYDVWWALSICGQLGYIIALPAAGFAYLGSIVDHKYNISPWGVIVGLVFAITISSMYVWKMVKRLEK